MKISKVITPLLLVGMICGVAKGQTIVTKSAADAAHISTGSPGTAMSNTGGLSVKTGSSSYNRYVVLRFDVSSHIGLPIVNATLRVDVDSGSGAAHNIRLYAFGVADDNGSQNWTGGQLGDMTYDSISAGIPNDTGLIPGMLKPSAMSGGTAVPVPSSDPTDVSTLGYIDIPIDSGQFQGSVSSAALDDLINADTDGHISILLMPNGNTVTSVRDPLNAELEYEALPASTYLGWAGDHGVNRASEDPDGDGVANLVEYALGGDPNDPSSTGLPIPRMVGSRMENAFTFEIEDNRLSFRCYVSDHVKYGTWMDVTDGLTTTNIVARPSGFNIAYVTNSISSPEGMRYMKIEVESIEPNID